MREASAEPLRDVDLGVDGISGNYVKFIGQLGRASGDAIVIAGAWLYLRSLPPGADYPLTASISAIMLVKLALALWLFKTLWTFGQALIHGARWLRLEAGGMQWAQQDGESRRVIFYRSRDQIIRCDETSRTVLAAEDAAGRQYRKRAALQDGIVLAVLVAGYFYLPAGLVYVRAALSASQQGMFDHWDAGGLVRLVFVLFVIVPRSVDYSMMLLESIIHLAGAQFMPGAKLRGA